MQYLPLNAVQVDKTVAEPESLKKLLIIWLMCIRLWEREINHQQWDELLKWILVFCLLSLGNGFSFLHHQVNRCRDAVFSFSQSQEQPVARRCVFLSPAAWAVYNMEYYLRRMFQLLNVLLVWQVLPQLFQCLNEYTCPHTFLPTDFHIHTRTHIAAASYKCT